MFEQIQWQLKEGWTTFFLAWGMVLIAGYTMYEADLTAGLQVLMLIGTLGFMSGFLLAKSQFPWRIAASFSIVYALFAIGFILGSRFLSADLTWNERVAELIWQQQEWLQKVFSGGTNREPLVFTVHTAFIFWVIGHTAAWYTFRTLRIWRVVLPSGILLLSVVYYYYGPKPLIAYMAIYMIMAMLYITRTYLAEQETEWRTSSVHYERSTTFNFLRASFGVALLALFIAWQLPALTASAAVNDALGGVNQPWRRFQNNWTRLYSSLRSYGGGINDPYGGSLPLGGPRNVGDSLVMDVFVPEKLPYAYWHSTTFETYEDGQWSAPDGDRVVHIPDDGLVKTPLEASRQVITQTVRNFIPNMGTLYGVPQVVGSDRQMFINRQLDGSGNNIITQVQSRYILQQGDVYNTQSSISVASVTELRDAGLAYPTWVDPYLQVPDSITPETIALAEELTASYNNNYDKVIAIRDYLRNNIEYNDQINAPPNDVEPIHYVLFELKEGYCNYYASAMAMMLRSQGIPARVSAGYAAGQFIDDANVYRVRASDAHTWVEVYFPRYGWIPFEPTASITVVERPLGEEGEGLFEPGVNAPNAPENNRNDFLEEDFLDPNERIEDDALNFDGSGAQQRFTLFGISDQVTLWRIAAGVVVLILSGVALYLGNIINTRIETDVLESYGRLSNWGKWLGLTPSQTQTPYERAETLTSVLPEGRKPIRNLTQQFVLHNFSPHDHTTEFNSQEEWRELRPLFLKRSLAKKWESFNQSLNWRSLRRRLRKRF